MNIINYFNQSPEDYDKKHPNLVAYMDFKYTSHLIGGFINLVVIIDMIGFPYFSEIGLFAIPLYIFLINRYRKNGRKGVVYGLIFHCVILVIIITIFSLLKFNLNIK